MDSGEDRDVRFYTDTIRTFVAVSTLGGIGRAARHLGASQPSVSQQIARLETRIGRKLFKRGKGGVVPTADGALLLRHAQAMIEINEAIGRNFGLGGPARIRVGMSEMFSLTSLHRVLWLVAKQNPGLSLRIVLGRTEVLKTGFDDGDFDLVVAGPLAVPPLARFLRREPLVWIGRADAPHPIPDPVALILPLDPSRLREAMLSALECGGRTWNASFEVSSVSIAEAAIDAGFGHCAALARMPLRSSVRLDRRCGLPDLPSVDYYLNLSERSRSNPIVSGLCKIIEDAAEAP